MKLKTRLTLAMVLTGLIPFAIITGLAIRTTNNIGVGMQADYERLARGIADKVDRNLFERYGDVQAFGVNKAIRDRNSWYQVGSEKNQIADAANSYANLYGFYLLSFLVDLDGRVIAVNDKDPKENSIETAYLYDKNFKNADWFRETLAGHFLKSDTLNGTHVQSVHVDEDIKRVYRGDGLVLGFSAPIKDAEGKTIGVWHNCADFSLVEEIVWGGYLDLKQQGFPNAEITLVDSKGTVLVDCDPAGQGKAGLTRDMNVLLKLNLAEKGVEAVRQLVAGKAGHGISVHAREQVELITGWAPSVGSLGFPGLKWGVLVRLSEKDALRSLHQQTFWIICAGVLGTVGLIVVGLRLSSKISGSLQEEVNLLQDISTNLDETGELIKYSSHTVSTGASEQAASLEETSASLEEISAMARRTAENAASGQALSQQTRDSATAGLTQLAEMTKTVGSIRSAVAEMEAAVAEMQSSNQAVGKIIKTIDEIAFQTNLLALNAAVEAARAGEAGMGFAVVADEVRSLAQRSASAAKETAERIESAMARSELGGRASQKVVQSLTAAELTAQNLADVFNGIVSQISSLNDVIAEMNSATQEQSVGVNQVNMAVTQLDRVTQNNASSAEENASSAERMNDQLHTLNDIVHDLQTMISGDANPESQEPEQSAPPKRLASHSKTKARRAPLRLKS